MTESNLTGSTCTGSREKSALDQVSDRVRQRQQEQQDKIKALYTKRDVELAHSTYLRQSWSTPDMLEDARHAANAWAQTTVRGLGIPKHMATCRKVDAPEAVLNMQKLGPGSTTTMSSNFRCPILNCQIYFSDQHLLQRHMDNASHNPCNPLAHLQDGRLGKNVLTTHVCPICTVIYPDYQSCLDHMQAQNHDVLMDALPVAGYICPQCLLVYPDRTSCDIHIDDCHHSDFQYPFAEDNQGQGKPVAVVRKSLDSFLAHCASSKWQICCVECEGDVENAKIKHHLQRKHTLVASSDLTPADVFGFLLKPFTCIQCLRLFDNLPETGTCSVHMCNDTVMGMYIDNDCKSFQQFVCRLGLETINRTIEINDCIMAEGIGEQIDKTSSTETESSRKELTDGSCIILNTSDSLDENSDISHRSDGSSFSGQLQKEPTMHSIDFSKVTGSESSNQRQSLAIHVKKDEPRESIMINPSSSTASNMPLFHNKHSKQIDGAKREFENDSNNLEQNGQPVKRPRLSPSNKCGFKMSNDVQENELRNTYLEVFEPDKSYDMHKNLADTTTVSKKTDKNEGICVPQCFAAAPECSTNRKVEWNLDNNAVAVEFSNTRQVDTYRTPVPCKMPKETPYDWLDTSKATDSRDTLRHFEGKIHGPYEWTAPVSPKRMARMKQVIFLDMDNWPSFFKRLPGPLPTGTFVWGFIGGGTVWKPPTSCPNFDVCCEERCFHLHRRSGKTKNAADFALCMTVGRMDALLPQEIPFTVLSGDKGFLEIQRQMDETERRAVVINPHHKSEEEIYIMIESVAEI